MPRLLGSRAALLAVIAVGVAILVVTGPGAVMRRAPPGGDMAIFADAGRAMALGRDPYAVDAVPGLGTVHAYASTPNFLIVSRMLAMVGQGTAYAIFTLIGFASLAAIAALLVGMARQEGRASPVDRLAVVAVVLLCPAAAQLLHLGQVTLFIGAATFAAFWFIAYRRRPALAGVFLAIACLKPTVPIFLVVWLLLEREALCLAVAAAITLLFTAYPLAMFGPIDLVQNWLDAAHRYAAAEFNVAESVEVVGLNPLLAALGIAAVPEVVVGVGLTALLWATRDRFTRLEQLGLLCGLTVLFSRLHNYDLIVVLPLLIAVLMRAPWTAASSVFGVAMVVLFYLPQRPLLMLCDAPVIGQWRMILIVVAGLWIAADPVGKRSRAPPLSAAP